MEAVYQKPYVPYRTFFASHNGSPLLSITFDLTNKKEQEVNNCGMNFMRLCDGADLLPVTAARLEWKSCRKTYIVSDTDVNTNFAVVLVDDDGTIIQIRLDINVDCVNTINDFALYGIIAGDWVLLGRGRIYVITASPQLSDEATITEQDSVDFDSFLAAIALSGHRVVYLNDDEKLDYADPTTTSVFAILGVTLGAVAQDAPGSVRGFGILIEPSWTWIPQQDLFLGLGGVLTQTVPTTDYLIRIGKALTPTKILIDIGVPILLD